MRSLLGLSFRPMIRGGHQRAIVYLQSSRDPNGMRNHSAYNMRRVLWFHRCALVVAMGTSLFSAAGGRGPQNLSITEHSVGSFAVHLRRLENCCLV